MTVETSSVLADRLRQWDRYRRWCLSEPELRFSLDVSRVHFSDAFMTDMEPPMARALDALEALENGSMANVDEGRQVGHYWLRDPGRAPTALIGNAISAVLSQIETFAHRVHEGTVSGAGGPFRQLVHVGIGGSAVGPQFLCDALGSVSDRLTVSFLDNSDPDGINRTLNGSRHPLDRTLVSVVSKCGHTPTPRAVMEVLEARYRAAGLRFADHAVATTMAGSDLDDQARREGWLARFPLWDWVGGRTSVLSAVGLLPAALQGANIGALIDGAASMDRLTRRRVVDSNPAALLALMWFWSGRGRGDKAMVLLPYRDRLAILPRYVQQLVMESLGKRLDRQGTIVEQGLTVFGHKGSSDQHAYLQQLLDGRNDTVITFVRTHRTHQPDAPELFRLADGASLHDHLFANLEGTRDALDARGRESITITLADTSERSLGSLIALFERAVGLYAELVGVNAYHQPGVDKGAALPVVALLRSVLSALRTAVGPLTAQEAAAAAGCHGDIEVVCRLLEHLGITGRHGVVMTGGPTPWQAHFSLNSAPAADGPAPATIPALIGGDQ